ncbi:MAG TPA: AAA family ATPase [Candidatus Limnocylindrales bacterium]|nr:AAA family ATPase [Candidatus Limnocylindrales bacterium]
MARCPLHKDDVRSLAITEKRGKVLVHCHGGCEQSQVAAALGLRANGHAPARQVEKVYTYRAADGSPAFEVVRYWPKDFLQRRPDGTWGVKGVEPVPYNLPAVLASDHGVVVVEGEKDADRLASLGIVATCNAGGAGKWRPEFARYLRGRTVVVIPDNDEAGRQHAADVARSLDGEDVRVLELPGLQPKGDVSTWLDDGHTADELRDLLRAAPVAVPVMPHGAEWVDSIDLPAEDPPMALPPMVLDEGPAVLFGMGETRKSILAQMVATTLATGRETVPGWRPTLAGPVVWLDYESGRLRFARRQRLLGSASILYVPCVRPIWDDVDSLATLVEQEGAVLVIVDSIVPASAGGAVSTKDAETAARYFGAVTSSLRARCRSAM